MATCPECDADIEVDEFDVDKGDQLSCPNAVRISKSPACRRLSSISRPKTTTTTTKKRTSDQGRRRRRRGRRGRREERRTRTGKNDSRRSRRSNARCRRSAPWSSPIAAASTARISPASRTGRSAAARCAITADSPELSGAPPACSRSRSPSSSASATRSSAPTSSSGPEYRANPANRCYYCKHELYTHLSRIAADRARGRRRRQQRRRSRRLSPGPPGGARVRRAQPARRGRSDQGRDPRAVAPRRAADLGRAGVGLSVVADSLSQRGDRREAPDDRARRGRRFAGWGSASAASVTTTISRGSRSGATRWRGRSSRKSARRSSAS